MSCKLKVVVHFSTNLIIIISFLLGFLDTFDEVFENEQSRKEQLGSSIVTILEHMSRGLRRSKYMPSPAELRQMKDDLNFKETEMHKSYKSRLIVWISFSLIFVYCF
ncbi:PREDICTED: intraflagellar transport protein 74 homolog [Acropora digitifera]|uniref:intraflagellar transport protein 74 homolog n=1 Tax=Acropora digitifera TaxID=70779 RepID=UPI00077A221D|nr:PREDICTED: intraflagellar transport protein 74 homolog [Acropora digitifera]